jgi:hypothetical protein
VKDSLIMASSVDLLKLLIMKANAKLDIGSQIIPLKNGRFLCLDLMENLHITTKTAPSKQMKVCTLETIYNGIIF